MKTAQSSASSSFSMRVFVLSYLSDSFNIFVFSKSYRESECKIPWSVMLCAVEKVFYWDSKRGLPSRVHKQMNNVLPLTISGGTYSLTRPNEGATGLFVRCRSHQQMLRCFAVKWSPPNLLQPVSRSTRPSTEWHTLNPILWTWLGIPPNLFWKMGMGMWCFPRPENKKPVAQRQEMVIGTLALL